MKEDIAIFGAGCFWGVESVFSKLNGVLKTNVGFMGGNVKDPSYERVCKGDTGHVEVVKIWFDSEKVSYKELLDIFWKNHNPTQLNRQGSDIGEQYKSVIFYTSEMQKEIAEESLKKKQEKLGEREKIVTVIVKAKEFYEAEEYHQKYFEKLGRNVC